MFKLLLILIISSVSATTHAHVPERSMDPVSRSGGLATRIGHYNVEIVADSRQMQLHIYSQGNRPLPSYGATANVRIIHSSGAMDLQLVSGGGNRLVSDWQAPPDKSVWAVIKVTMFGEEPVDRLISSVPINTGSTVIDRNVK